MHERRRWRIVEGFVSTNILIFPITFLTCQTLQEREEVTELCFYFFTSLISCCVC